MKTKKFLLSCLVALMVLGIVGNFEPETIADLPEYPNYTTIISFSTWFQALMTDFRTNIHGQLNRSTWFWEGWNLTSVQWTQSVNRWSLSDYLFGVVAMHKLTGDNQWLGEAIWLVDNYLLHEGSVAGFNQSSWHLYQRQPAASKGWIWHDSRIWMAMDYINRQNIGLTYDVASRLNYFHGKAAIYNTTDLAWMYDWFAPYADDYYVQNAFSWVAPLYGLFNQSGYADYTINATKLYHSLERFRLANQKYKYKIADNLESSRYTLISLLNILIGYKYMPSVYNITKIQQTLNAFSYEDLAGSKEYDRNAAVGVAIVASTIPSLALPDQFQRVLSMYYNLMEDYYLEHWWANRVFFHSRYYMDCWADLITWALSHLAYLNDAKSWTKPTPIDQQNGNYHYFITNLDNNTYYVESADSWLILPTWRTSVAETRLNKEHSTIDLTPAFNTTSGQWEDSWADAGVTYDAEWDTHGYSWNVSSSSRVDWRLLYGFGWGWYTYKLIFPNGTVANMPLGNNEKLNGDTAFAVEIRTTSTQGSWILFNTDNSTLTKTNSTNYVFLDSQVTKWEGHLLFVFHTSLDADGWAHIEAEIAEALTRMKNGQNWTKREEFFPRTQDRIIHSDANITGYSDEITSLSKLSFTLNYESTHTSITYVYALEKPSIVFGASSWIYDNKTKAITINVFHTTSSEEIIVLFAKQPESPPGGSGRDLRKSGFTKV